MATADESGMEGEVLERRKMTAATEVGDEVVERNPAKELLEFGKPRVPVKTYGKEVYVLCHRGAPVAVYDNPESAAIGAFNQASFEKQRRGEHEETIHTFVMPVLS